MSYYDDLSEYSYHGSEFYRPGTKNVGWLALGHEFMTAEPTPEVLSRLWTFCKVSVAQMRGIHQCEFCPNSPAYYAERNGEHLLLGSSEIRVFSESGTIYAAPTLIYHYVEFHKYKPPDEFVLALCRGAAPPSRNFFDRLKELGLDWHQTSAPDVVPVPFRFGPFDPNRQTK